MMMVQRTRTGGEALIARARAFASIPSPDNEVHTTTEGENFSRRLRAGPRPIPSNSTAHRVEASKNREIEDRNAGRRPSFHTREFPKDLVDYRSEEGRDMLLRCLSARTAEQYLPLTAAYQMQSEPAYCALTTLAVALNALNVDPGKVWKGGWRWFTETNLDFCHRRGACQTLGLEEGAGLNLFDLRCVAKRNGAALHISLADGGNDGGSAAAEGLDRDTSNDADGPGTSRESSSSDLTRGVETSLAAFRDAVVEQCSTPDSPSVMITSFDRQVLGQTGGGHFSPVAAYDVATDSALVLDVARFKYPPFWVNLPLLWSAMERKEPTTGRPRGYAFVKKRCEASTTKSPPHPPGSLPATSLGTSAYQCCMDDGTHETCSSVCSTPHL